MDRETPSLLRDEAHKHLINSFRNGYHCVQKFLLEIFARKSRKAFVVQNSRSFDMNVWLEVERNSIAELEEIWYPRDLSLLESACPKQRGQYLGIFNSREQ